MSFKDFLNTLRLISYIVLTLLVLIAAFIPEGWLFYFYVIEKPHMIHFLLSPLYFFIAYCLTVLMFGIIHSQVVIRLTLPYRLKEGHYKHHSSEGRLVAMRLSADGIFKSMIKVFTFLPFIWGIFIFPYGLRLYGLKCGKNVHIATKTWIDTSGMVEIGDNCFIGWNSAISGHANEGREFVLGPPVKIKKNSTIGSLSIIAPGVEIGENSIIGALSGFKKGTKVPPNGIWVGTPAKLIRMREKKLKKE